MVLFLIKSSMIPVRQTITLVWSSMSILISSPSCSNGFLVMFSSSFPLFLSGRRKTIITRPSTSSTTPYTITCPATDRYVLQQIVSTHVQSRHVYQKNKPIATHTIEAFQQVLQCISQYTDKNKNCLGIILDSGCGTGKSTCRLGKMYPQHFILGIDRSFVRLNKNVLFRKQQLFGHDSNHRTDETENGVLLQDRYENRNNIINHETSCQGEEEEQQEEETLWKTRILTEYPNVLLVRADLIDFWFCYLQHLSSSSSYTHNNTLLPIVKHYLLYPNPYPKLSRIKHRWYAHSSFPILLQLGGDLIIRSNWKVYLDEFYTSIVDASQILGKTQGEYNFASRYIWKSFSSSSKNNRTLSSSSIHMDMNESVVQQIDTTVSGFQPMTNFEQKYVDIGESIFELTLYCIDKEHENKE